MTLIVPDLRDRHRSDPYFETDPFKLAPDEGALVVIPQPGLEPHFSAALGSLAARRAPSIAVYLRDPNGPSNTPDRAGEMDAHLLTKETKGIVPVVSDPHQYLARKLTEFVFRTKVSAVLTLGAEPYTLPEDSFEQQISHTPAALSTFMLKRLGQTVSLWGRSNELTEVGRESYTKYAIPSLRK